MIRRVVLLSLFLAGLPAAAQTGFQGEPDGDNPGEAIEKIGLLGRWARDCAQPVASGNPHLVFRRNGRDAEYTVYFPGNSATTRAIDRVRETAPGRIAMRFTTKSDGASGLAFDVVMVKEGNRQRVIESVGSDRQTYVRNGIVVASGAENPWQTRCADR